jgi:hypothetical protein
MYSAITSVTLDSSAVDPQVNGGGARSCSAPAMVPERVAVRRWM